MNVYFVYIYRYPESGEPFYVGYGKNKRHLDHLKEAKKDTTPKPNQLKLNTIRKILRNGLEPIIDIVDSNLSKCQAIELEIFLISMIGTQTHKTGPLTNLTHGGDGGDTFSNNPNKENIRKKHSENNKKLVTMFDPSLSKNIRVSVDDNRIDTGELIPLNSGKKRNKETRKLQSESSSFRNQILVSRLSDRKVMSLGNFYIYLNDALKERVIPPKIYCCRLSDRKVITVNHLNRDPNSYKSAKFNKPRPKLVCRLYDRKEMDLANFIRWVK